ncbi:zinc finger, CCHC-type containing protein [Tanacetum coccineum]|uniref:Zinc finger, CCHC-type containing protein n=1 Tax=Tanacetum coccineum TaxID=301880 RepID=A0ABQ4XR18_9ASTR
MLQYVKSYLGKCFAMKDLGEAAYILGIKIYRDRSRRLIGLCQSAYIEKILKRFHMENSKRGSDIKQELRVSCYTDAGYLTDADDLKSQTRYVFILNGGAVDWKSAKQSIFANFILQKLVILLPFMLLRSCIAIAIAKESGITKGARHFRAKVHYLREVIEFGDIKLEKVHTDDNLADPFTKALAFPNIQYILGILEASQLVVSCKS